jgi:hypothetical protein
VDRFHSRRAASILSAINPDFSRLKGWQRHE